MRKTLIAFVIALLPLVGSAAVTQTISAKNYEKLNKVQELFSANKEAQGKALLDQMKSQKDLNNYTRAQISNFSGQYYYGKGNYRSALSEYKKVLKDPTGIPAGVYNQTYYVIAQLYFNLEDYKSALNYAQKWFNTTKTPPADAYMLIGQAYYMMQNFNKALPNVQKGISLYEKEGKKPKENWLVLLRGIYVQKNNHKSALPIVRKLLALYPKKQYLTALAQTYGALGNNAKVASVLQAMDDNNLLSEKKDGAYLLNLASIYLEQEAYYKAALILDKGLKKGLIPAKTSNYKLAAQSYSLSKDYALSVPYMAKTAASSGNPKDYFELGQSYLYLNRYKEAEKALRKAVSIYSKDTGKVKKYKFKTKESAKVTLAMVLVELENFDGSIKIFESILTSNPTSKVASQWLNYAKNEKSRKALDDAPVVINTDVNI